MSDDYDTNDTRVFMPQNDPYAVPKHMRQELKDNANAQKPKNTLEKIDQNHTKTICWKCDGLWWFLVKNQQKTINKPSYGFDIFLPVEYCE